MRYPVPPESAAPRVAPVLATVPSLLTRRFGADVVGEVLEPVVDAASFAEERVCGNEFVEPRVEPGEALAHNNSLSLQCPLQLVATWLRCSHCAATSASNRLVRASICSCCRRFVACRATTQPV